jgi:predicted dehydrogenase
MLRWGILGAAKIAKNRVIPAIQSSSNGRVVAIATRNPADIISYAETHDVPHIYDNYDVLLETDDIDAVYIPLPNHLHVPYAIKGARAGKHVLCEKPIALDSQELEQLIEVQKECGVLIQEAFMVMSNPLWQRAKTLLQQGEIGELRTLTGHFSYMNTDPGNVRNVPEYGGGALMDIGCYLTLAALYYFEDNPIGVAGFQHMDPTFNVDYLTSGVINFPAGQAVITCSTQSMPQQSLVLDGTNGRIRFDIPFSHPDDQPGILYIDKGPDIFRLETTKVQVDAFNHYRMQVELFADCADGSRTNHFSLEYSRRNMELIDSLRIKK